MLGGMSRLVTKSDVIPTVIALIVCLMIVGILGAMTKSPGTKLLLLIVSAGIFLAVLLPTVRGLSVRTRKLMAGHCPNPLCHGIVHHSELVPRGFVVCPTCKKTWPEIKGMQFKVTVRQG